MSRVVEIRGLSIAFPGPDQGRRGAQADVGTRPALQHVVRDLDLDIGPGEAVGMLGRSGSGKSMTALALLGLVPRPGRVAAEALRVAGRDLLTLDAAGWRDFRGRRSGMVFQDPATTLNPTLPVGRQLAEPLEAHGLGSAAERRTRVLSLLDEVELGGDPAILSRYPHQFSGGQRQRLVLAMALACEPDLLIADEPTTALDVTTQARIVDLVGRIRRHHGTAVLWITHDLAVAAGAADRIAVLHEGRVVEDGPTDRLMASPAHPVTREFLEAARWEAVSPAPAAADPTGRAATHTDGAGTPTDQAGSGGLVAGTPPAREAGPSRHTLSSPQHLLAVRDLRFRYTHTRPGSGRAWLRRRHAATTPALQGVSLEMRAGETLAVVGESGSGKSTLARLVVGLLRAREGEMRFRGRPMSRGAGRRDRGLARQIQMVFQDPFASLNPRQRVGRVIREPLDIHRIGEAASRGDRVAALMKDVGLDPGLAWRLPHQLSGGERQRVAIARALATDPHLLVADEPVTSLDAPVQRQVMELLDQLRRERQLACLLVAHDLATVRRVADRVAVMAGGRIVEEGPTASVFEAPRHPATRALVAAVPRLPERGSP